MDNKTFGFIGGGRITKILLGGLKRANALPKDIIVSDINIDILDSLKEEFPRIQIVQNENRLAANQDLVFIATHIPTISGLLNEIHPHLNSNSILVSLAPKFTIAKISEKLDGFQRIVRMTPNAPSIVNKGYNPISFSHAFAVSEKNKLIDLFTIWGDCPEVAEESLEIYTIFTAIGPTYFWFQLYELQNLAKSFGLSDHAIEQGLSKTIFGAVKTMSESGLSPEEVMDLVLLKPLGDREDNIKEEYRSHLGALFTKLRD